MTRPRPVDSPTPWTRVTGGQRSSANSGSQRHSYAFVSIDVAHQPGRELAPISSLGEGLLEIGAFAQVGLNS